MSETTQAQSETQTTGEKKPSFRDRAKPATESFGVRLSEKAAEQIKAILERDNYPDTMYLFVGVKGGGCSGLQYVLDLRDEAHAPVADTDEVFESQGIHIVCDLKSYVVGNLTGTLIDYQDGGLMGSGFVFKNPNAKHACGCGSSYSA
ncbi:MAG: iron-sulfur cluster assembly accessory protein [Planctomycetota bacterium]|nr:MAG: iron-sulfur cluster assembly accessory protein [Planctomycetota bacterium]